MTTQQTISAPRSNRIQRLAIACAAVAALLFAAAMPQAALAQVIPSQLPAPVRGLEVVNKLGQRVPLELQFTSEQGKTVSLKEYFNRKTEGGKTGRPVILQMMYYRCPILCPQVLQRLTGTLNEIDLTVGKDFDVLLVSFDPRDTSKDSTERKSAQLISYNRGSQETANGWNFLTSTPESAKSLGESLGFPFRALENGEFSHGAALYILTPEGKVSRSLVGLNYPAADVKLALLEASGGKIGTWKDAFVLWCYHFDPDAGTYTVAAMRVMRVGAIITIAFVGSLLLMMWRFEKRKRAARASLAGAPSFVAVSSDTSLPSVRLPGASAPLTGSTP